MYTVNSNRNVWSWEKNAILKTLSCILHSSDDSILRFLFWYGIDMIFWKYRNIDTEILKMYVNFIQAQEQDVNVQQGSLLYINTIMCQWTLKLTMDCCVIKLRHDS